MGTVGSYTGGGGADGEALRDTISDWLDALPQAAPEHGEGEPPDEAPTERPSRHRLDPKALLSAVGLLRPRVTRGGSDGQGGGGGGGGGGGSGRAAGGGASRSVAASAGTAGRAAAGAYAFATGDAATLARLGLDYDRLRGLGDSFEVVRAIVDAAFESAPPDSSIPDHEQRLVAADIAEWVIEESDAGHTPTPEGIVRKTIAAIIAQAVLVETGDIASQHPQGAMTDEEISETAEVLAEQAELSLAGATEAEFSQAIEEGIETLRRIKDAGEE